MSVLPQLIKKLNALATIHWCGDSMITKDGKLRFRVYIDGLNYAVLEISLKSNVCTLESCKGIPSTGNYWDVQEKTLTNKEALVIINKLIPVLKEEIFDEIKRNIVIEEDKKLDKKAKQILNKKLNKSMKQI